jgi:hypothetical protein
MFITIPFALRTGFARWLSVTAIVVAGVLLSVPAFGKIAPPGWPDSSSYYDWTEAASVIVVGTVNAIDDTAMQVAVSQVLRGDLQSKRIAVSPSLVFGCVGPSRVLQVGDQAIFFMGVAGGNFALVYPGTVLNVRFAGSDTVPGISRLLQIAALPQKDRRERAVIDLLGSKNKVLQEAARQFVSAHVVFSPDVNRFAPQLISKLSSSPDPEVRRIAAQGLSRAKGEPVMKALVSATRDPNVEVVCAASEGLGRFNKPESIAALLSLFRHENPEVRVRACLDIDQHVTPAVVKALIKATCDPIAKVRRSAATGLVYCIREKKADAAIPRLKEMLPDPDVEVRGRAAETLAETRDPALVHTFLAMLGDRPLSENEEIPILRALGMLPGNDPTVRDALSRRVPRLAETFRLGRAPWAVAGLLESAHTLDARRILEDAAKNHPRDDVRQYAALAIKHWDTGI